VTVPGDTIIADLIYGTVIAGGFWFLLSLGERARPQLPRDDASGEFSDADALTASLANNLIHARSTTGTEA
jgi:hypothetical protein